MQSVNYHSSRVACVLLVVAILMVSDVLGYLLLMPLSYGSSNGVCYVLSTVVGKARRCRRGYNPTARRCTALVEQS